MLVIDLTKETLIVVSFKSSLKVCLTQIRRRGGVTVCLSLPLCVHDFSTFDTNELALHCFPFCENPRQLFAVAPADHLGRYGAWPTCTCRSPDVMSCIFHLRLMAYRRLIAM